MGIPALLLGHGASGNARSMEPWVTALARHGCDALALDLPKARATAAVAVMLGVLRQHSGAAVGGHSYGGRVASMLAAEQSVSGLVLLSYPLHRPGHPEDLRTEHWVNITCPVLLLSGDRDPFARRDLLEQEAKKLAQAELVVYDGLGHGVLPRIDDAAPRIAGFLRECASRDVTRVDEERPPRR